MGCRFSEVNSFDVMVCWRSSERWRLQSKVECSEIWINMTKLKENTAKSQQIRICYAAFKVSKNIYCTHKHKQLHKRRKREFKRFNNSPKWTGHWASLLLQLKWSYICHVCKLAHLILILSEPHAEFWLIYSGLQKLKHVLCTILAHSISMWFTPESSGLFLLLWM